MSPCAVTGAGNRHVSAIMPIRAVPEAEMATLPLPCPFALALAFALAFPFSFGLGEPSLSGDPFGVVLRPPFGGGVVSRVGLAAAALWCFFW